MRYYKETLPKWVGNSLPKWGITRAGGDARYNSISSTTGDWFAGRSVMIGAGVLWIGTGAKLAGKGN